MNRFRLIGIVCILVLLPILQACGGAPATAVAQPTSAAPAGTQPIVPATGGAIAKNSSSSGPIAISDDDSLLIVANNLDDSVSILNVAGDANAKVAEVKVGDEPRTVAITPDKRFAYVTNQGSATVSVIDLTTNQKTQDIAVGVEPYGIALTPDGARAYVANSASNTVSVIDTASNAVVA
ncbi:MAG TPA: beta-propeller fold lactonase family protein, partial [Anaerolineales bacterium]|nr:beta-propeller fold lactonase family protein [Anaerolineales bacterium]